MTTPDRDYQLMMSALADVARRRDAELSTTDRAYQDNAALAAGELARADSEAVAAERWAGAAASQVHDVDRDAARLWQQLRQARGVRVRELGEVPAPVPVEVLPRAAIEGPQHSAHAPRQSARTLLAQAADRLEVTARPPVRRPLARRAQLLLPLLGALAAGAVGLLAAGLVTVGDSPVPFGPALRLIGWLAFLIAPSAGVPVAAALAHRRDARLDVAGVGLTLLGGMIAATLLSVSFAASR